MIAKKIQSVRIILWQAFVSMLLTFSLAMPIQAATFPCAVNFEPPYYCQHRAPGYEHRLGYVNDPEACLQLDVNEYASSPADLYSYEPGEITLTEFYDVSFACHAYYTGTIKATHLVGPSAGYVSTILVYLHLVADKHRANYVVKLFPISDSPESDITLTSVEPGGATDLIARVYDSNGQLVPDAQVRLEVDVIENSGGHQQHDHALRNTKHMGTLNSQYGTFTDNGKVLAGKTQADGGLPFTFTAPAPAGDHKITASCTDGKNCTPEGPDTMWVGYKGLQPVGDSAVYRLIPNAAKDPGHPDNHYLTLTAVSRLTILATLYHDKYPDLAVLHLNDASLERGGIFDLNHNWKSPHFEHCRGAVIDIRANGAEGALDITSQTDPMIKKFQELTNITGASALWDVPKDKNKKRRWELRHFHIQLMGQEELQCP